MGACNFILAALYPLHRDSSERRLFAITCVVPLLLAVSMTDSLFSSYFRWDPSGRTISQELQRRGIPTMELAVRTMSRSQRYSLSFYLHQEIAEWDREHPREGYVLAGGRGCRTEVAPELTCSELPFDLGTTGFFLYRIERRSPPSLPRSRQPQ